VTHAHTYSARLSWSGSTAVGYDEYDRTHRVTVPSAAAVLTLTSDPAFRGNSELLNPEQLLLASASSCQLLSFLAVAARSRIDVLSYEDDAEAVMPEGEKRMRVTRITLRPHIVVMPGVAVEKVHRLVRLGHDSCFIANSLNSEVVIDATIEHAPDPAIG
jgi:organic hydroperoxide reductase OsmC/OhrA